MRRGPYTRRDAGATLGALSLSAKCEDLERLSRSGQVENAAQHVAAIEGVYDAVRSALKTQLGGVAEPGADAAAKA